MSGAFGGLLASAILRLDGFGSLRSWRMIFVIEGLVTMIIAIGSYFTLTDRPDSAKWLSAEEKGTFHAFSSDEKVADSAFESFGNCACQV